MHYPAGLRMSGPTGAPGYSYAAGSGLVTPRSGFILGIGPQLPSNDAGPASMPGPFRLNSERSANDQPLAIAPPFALHWASVAIEKPWVLQAFRPLQEFPALLQALWPLQALVAWTDWS